MFGPNGDFSHPNSRTLNLANLGIDEGMYVDTVHYTPLFNEKIASEIHQKISVQFATNND
jgi:predicted Zn-dependent protease